MAGQPQALVRSPTLMLLTLCVILPSALLFGLSLWLGATPFLLNLDLLVVYALVVWMARRGQVSLAAWAGAGLVIVVCAVPVLRVLGLVYIADPALIPGYLSFWRLWPWAAFSGAFAALAAAYVGLALVLPRARPAGARVLPVLVALLSVPTVDAVAGGSSLSPGLLLLGLNVSTSSAYQVYATARQIALTPRFQVVATPPRSAMGHALANPTQRILSVAVESWGWYRQDALNHRLLRDARAAAGEKVHVEVFLQDFVGSTLSGELRELCGVLSRGVPRPAEVAGLHTGCLPQRLRAMGYETFAAHGNPPAFYDRAHLYPALGFDQRMFQADFQSDKSTHCPWAVFSGPCDRQVLESAVRFLGSRERAFAHVMTLDTHLPLRPRDGADRDCTDVSAEEDATRCIYIHRFSDLLLQISELVRDGAVDRAYVYGDHPPPYADVRHRDEFLSRQVPWMVMERVATATRVRD